MRRTAADNDRIRADRFVNLQKPASKQAANSLGSIGVARDKICVSKEYGFNALRKTPRIKIAEK
eukprot:3614073-Pleurochrysis_carterae.AAC.1